MAEAQENMETQSALESEFGLTKDDIVNGDKPEYTPIDKKEQRNYNRNGEDLYAAKIVDKVTEATFKDMADLYKNNTELEAQISSDKQAIDNLNSQLNEANQQVSRLSTVSETSQNRLTTATGQVDDFAKEIGRLIKTVNNMTENINNIKSQLDAANAKYDEAAKAKDAADQNNKEYQAKLDDMKAQLDSANNNTNEILAANKQLSDDVNSIINAFSERYGEVAKSILELQNEAPNSNESASEEPASEAAATTNVSNIEAASADDLNDVPSDVPDEIPEDVPDDLSEADTLDDLPDENE